MNELTKNKDLLIEDLQDRLDCEHKLTEAAGSMIRNLKEEIKDKNSEIKNLKHKVTAVRKISNIKQDDIEHYEDKIMSLYDDIKHYQSILKY